MQTDRAFDAPAGGIRDRSPDVAADLARWLRSHLLPGAALRGHSATVAPGDAFFALPGQRTDGRRFIEQALTRGAAAVVCEAGLASALDDCGVPLIAVENLQSLVGPIASAFHQYPTRDLDVFAVTGTNGKTSVTRWVGDALERLGRRAATIGTLGAGHVGRLEVNGMTTPDALVLQALFARLRAEGADSVAIEASSIGLAAGRLNGTRIGVAAFTNLTRDHLDFHRTMDAYGAAKARLFSWPGLRAAVVNGDDPYAAAMLAAIPVGPNAPLRIAYGLMPDTLRALGVDARLFASEVLEDDEGLRLRLGGDFGNGTLSIRVMGRFNASNALAVAGCLLAAGHGLDAVADAISGLQPAPGRMQRIDGCAAPLALVDYAHSPDALTSVLAALRPLAARRRGHLWCVFGAGGDRDPGKRGAMGAAVEQGADHVVVTSDNPRGEPPLAIIDQILAGMRGPPALVEPDRESAIRAAVRAAAPADVLLVAGKGHEDYQEIAGVRQPFSDAAVLRQACALVAGGADADAA